ncbi:hypothetical protein [Paenibacillus piri]|uniref:Uncharacterized protein n=1 Tax=Paenibacillus piri TaxID=2547395 RepID=A0A4R5KI56_9BACL|nr:hypothetical protein [Paenibacillus piri]TDF95066.1 hypothetical protein E1757_21240 [Paenibacillus piri]
MKRSIFTFVHGGRSSCFILYLRVYATPSKLQLLDPLELLELPIPPLEAEVPLEMPDEGRLDELLPELTEELFEAEPDGLVAALEPFVPEGLFAPDVLAAPDGLVAAFEPLELLVPEGLLELDVLAAPDELPEAGELLKEPERVDVVGAGALLLGACAGAVVTFLPSLPAVCGAAGGGAVFPELAVAAPITAPTKAPVKIPDETEELRP